MQSSNMKNVETIGASSSRQNSEPADQVRFHDH